MNSDFVISKLLSARKKKHKKEKKCDNDSEEASHVADAETHGNCVLTSS